MLDGETGQDTEGTIEAVETRWGITVSLYALFATVCSVLLLLYVAISILFTGKYMYMSVPRFCFSDRTCAPRNENDIIDTAIETCPCPRGAATSLSRHVPVGVGTVSDVTNLASQRVG